MTTLVLAAPIEKGSRGRNGFFSARSIDIHTTLAESARDALYPACVTLDVHSGRRGKSAPVILRLSLEDAVILAEQLLKSVGAAVLTPEQLAQAAGPVTRCAICGVQGGRIVPKGSADAYCAHCGEYWPPADERVARAGTETGTETCSTCRRTNITVCCDGPAGGRYCAACCSCACHKEAPDAAPVL